MKASLLAIVLSISAFVSSVSRADIIRDCENSLQEAQANLLEKQDLFGMGEITRTEVSAAELRLLTVRLQCGNIENDQFCKEAPVVAQSVLEGMLEESRIGMRSKAEVKAARKAVRQVSAQCQSSI